jgi:hypothetical protein
MRSKSLFSLVFASVLVGASTAPVVAQTTYTVVPGSNTAILEQTTFAPDNEILNKASYRAMFRGDAFATLNQVLAIQARTARSSVTADEMAMFQAIYSGQAGKYTFAEAALIASGVHDLAQRKQYLAKIDEIIAGAKGLANKQTTIKGKAQAIFKYLGEGPMKAGYDGNVYSLGQLLDEGHYNCVSSCVMFNIVAHGIGIEVGAVVQPGHIFARIPGYDVQTTSGRIYSSDLRLKNIHDTMVKFNVPMENFDSDHPYHEVGDFGILLEIYQNIATHARDNKQFDLAAVDALKQVCLDPTMPAAGSDVKAYLNKWFNASTTNHDLVTAMAIARLYRQISRDPSLANKMDQCVVNAVRQLASR